MYAHIIVCVRLTAVAVLDSSLSMKAGTMTASAASPWDPVLSVTTTSSNGAHPPTVGVDDEFDLLSSRSKSPPNISATAAGTSAMLLIY